MRPRPSEDLPTRPWWATAPIRVRRGLTAPNLRIHTFQAAAAYDALQRDGVLRPDSRLAEPDFARAYAWMQRQADRRLPSRGDGLLWCWGRTTRRNLIAQARHAGGDVLITAEVPGDLVLLSDFGDWHAVLNQHYAGPRRRGESDVEFCARIDAEIAHLDRRLAAADLTGLEPIDTWPADLRLDIEATWPRIFDTAAYRPHHHLQGVVHEVWAEWVTRAVRIASGRGTAADSALG